MLEVTGLETRYGRSQVLFGVDLAVRRGEVVALLGRNGMGKTTTIRSIMGLTPSMAGTITFDGRPVRGQPSYKIARLGLGLVPEGRCIFPSLTVWENLTATAATRPGQPARWTTDAIVELFPWIEKRRTQMGGQLSGGEQQMLAVARALMTNPGILLLDEPLEGLAPIIVEELVAALRRMIAAEGTAFILIEQHAATALDLTHDAVIIERGRIVHRARSADLAADAATLERLIGLKVG